ncbi:MAG: sporulation integral membrane protein YtvI [Clostridia bacterium]|nr:sporulation integral membrane protein YtvI [Clostridia bacterium]
MNYFENRYKKYVRFALALFLFAALAYVFFRYLLYCFLPFLTAFTVSAFLQKPINKIVSKTRLSRAFVVVLAIIIIFSLLSEAVYLLSGKVLSELSGLSGHFNAENLENVKNTIYLTLENLLSFLPESVTKPLFSEIRGILRSIDSVFAFITSKILPLAAKTAFDVLKMLPQILLFLGITVISTFYFTYDYDVIVSFIKKQMSEKTLIFSKDLKTQFFSTVGNVLRAYGIIFLMTFTELLIGLTLIGEEYPTVVSLITAFVDFLPVFGTGTVLIPWSIFLFLVGNAKKALCIAALYVIITVVRQISEPKIIGDAVGIHPVVNLISMYFGLKLAGTFGLVFFPFAVIIIKNLNENGSIHLYKNPDETRKTSQKGEKNDFRSGTD